jgi:hydrogen peroxide-dependent heme synthase
MTTTPSAHPPETLEGWYVLHQVFRSKTTPPTTATLTALAKRLGAALSAKRPARGPGKEASGDGGGWSCCVRLIGSKSDLMVIHFRDTLDAIGAAQETVAAALQGKDLDVVYSFLSVTEAGLYHITAELARATDARGGKVGDSDYISTLGARAVAERESPHVKRRLYPELPPDMPYVCFYPMTKRRDEGQNWYSLSLDERSRLMQSHGLTGRRYAGKVQQVISGAIGLDAWEWGVTLFARDPLDFKKLVTEMRFDEVSARYAVFGDFYVGKLILP